MKFALRAAGFCFLGLWVSAVAAEGTVKIVTPHGEGASHAGQHAPAAQGVVEIVTPPSRAKAAQQAPPPDGASLARARAAALIAAGRDAFQSGALPVHQLDVVLRTAFDLQEAAADAQRDAKALQTAIEDRAKTFTALTDQAAVAQAATQLRSQARELAYLRYLNARAQAHLTAAQGDRDATLKHAREAEAFAQQLLAASDAPFKQGGPEYPHYMRALFLHADTQIRLLRLQQREEPQYAIMRHAPDRLGETMKAIEAAHTQAVLGRHLPTFEEAQVLYAEARVALAQLHGDQHHELVSMRRAMVHARNHFRVLEAEFAAGRTSLLELAISAQRRYETAHRLGQARGDLVLQREAHTDFSQALDNLRHFAQTRKTSGVKGGPVITAYLDALRTGHQLRPTPVPKPAAHLPSAPPIVPVVPAYRR
jgi:hypothetical protein